MAQQKPSNRIPWSNVRWLTASIGGILLIFGQFQSAGSAIQVTAKSTLGNWLTDRLHLGVPDIGNVLVGLPILILGGVLIAVSLRGLYLLPVRAEEFAQEKPPAVRLIRSAWPWLLAGVFLLGILLFQLSSLKYEFYSPFLWVIPLLIFAIITAVWDRRRGVDLSPHISRSDLVWLTGLLAAGLLIGTYRLQGWPDQLMGDEGNFWTIARDLAIGKFHPSIFGNGVYSFPILSSIVQAGIMRLFGITMWGWRMASVLPGIITVVPLYLLAKDVFNKRVAVAACIVLLASPYFLVFARLGYNNIQALFITVLALYWLYAGLRRNSHCLTFLAGCAVGLSFYTYFGARGIIFIAVMFIALMWLSKKIPLRQALSSLALLSLAFFLVTTPYFVYGLHQDAQTMGFKTFESVFFNVFNGGQFYTDAELFKYVPVIHLGGNDLFFNPPIYAVLFSRGLIRTLLAFQKPWLISEHYIAFPLAGTIGAIFYLLGLGLAFRNIKEPRNQLLIVWFLTYIVGFSALNTVPPRHTHMVALIPALAVLIGLGVNAFAEAIGYASAWFKKHINVTLGILLAAIALGGLYDYFIFSPHKYHPQPDQVMSWAGLNSQGEAFAYVYEDPAEQNFKPYYLDEFDKSIPFRTIAYADVVAGKPVTSPAPKTVIFFPPDLAAKIYEALRKQWGNALIPRIFYSTDGTPVLAAGMNTPFVFEEDRPFISTLVDAFQHWAFIILLLLLLLLLGLAAFLPASWFNRLPSRLAALWEWFNRPAPVEGVDEAAEETILIPEAHGDISAQSLAAQLPEWVEQLNNSGSPEKTGRWQSQVKSIRSPDGKDVYIRIHIPALRLPFKRATTGQGISVPPIHFPSSVILILSIFLALAGQFVVAHQRYIPGFLLYMGCAAGLFIWSRRNPRWMGLFTGQIRILPRAEIILAILLLLAVAFTRFYDLGTRVYGLEADETKWTVQSWYSTILHVDQGEFATAHYQYLPVSFWVRSFFLNIFGLNFISARVESACLSLLSAVFLYFLVRRLTSSPPMAWLSTALYSFSFVELNKSHQALHNTTVEIWMIAGLFLLILALQERKYWQFLTAGLVLALGMLTYETYFPTPLIAAVFLVGFAIYRVARKKDNLLVWLKRALVFIWPIALLFFIYIQKYIASQSYHFEFLTQASANGSGFSGLAQFLLKNSADLLKTLFVKVVWTDALINWPGPFLNPWLIAFVGIGIIYNLLNLRRPYFAFIPLWFLFNIIYAPILVGSVWPRILYTSLGPLAIWGAMGLWTSLAALRAWFDGLKLKFAVPVFLLLLAAILVRDYSIFASSLLDPIDRQKRRELADLTSQSAAVVPMILFPYETNQNDSVSVESHVLLFSVAGAKKNGLEAAKNYQPLPFDQVMPTLYQDRQLTGVDIFFDKTATNMIDDRLTALQVILHCYPKASLKASGRFFEVFHLGTQALIEPECYQAPSPLTISPPEGTVLSSPASPTLEWDPNGVASTSHSLVVERKLPSNYWIEVEDAFAGPGWSSSAEYVNGFNGNGFLYDNWESGTAGYALPVEQAGTYRLWIRTYKREKNDQVNYISINGTKTEIASNRNDLNTWVWEAAGVYSLESGLLPISLSRSYGKDPEYSVFIDTILLTPDLTDPPERISIWEKVLDTGVINSTSTQYRFQQSLPAGDYRWQVRLYDGNKLIDSSGSRGVVSPTATFTVVAR